MHRHCQEHVRGLRQQPLLLGVSNKHVVEQGNESTKTKVCEQSSSLVKDEPVLLQRLSSHQHLREVQAALLIPTSPSQKSRWGRNLLAMGLESQAGLWGDQGPC